MMLSTTTKGGEDIFSMRLCILPATEAESTTVERILKMVSLMPLPHIANVTSIGRGVSAGKRAITFRDNAGGQYWNSIFTMWGKGIDVEDLGAGQEHSLNRLNTGDLMIMHNVFDGVANDTIEDIIVDNNGNDLTGKL